MLYALWLLYNLVLLCGVFPTKVQSHGFLQYPKSRNFIASTAGNYCPHCLNGGTVERVSESGKLKWPRGEHGICGDAKMDPVPRAHEAGGKFYAPGTFETLKQGDALNINLTITTNHNGRFEFRVCRVSGGYDDANTTEAAELTEDCLNQNVLKQANVRGAQKPGDQWFYTTPGDPMYTEYSLWYDLPKDLTCDGVSSHCVLQWHWVTMNSCVPKDSPKQYRRPIALQYCEDEGSPYPEVCVCSVMHGHGHDDDDVCVWCVGVLELCRYCYQTDTIFS